jgi:ribosomal protein S1
MRKVKEGRTLFCSDENFDWSLYENGYNGGSSLKVNGSVNVNGKDKVYCHEKYAQSLYNTLTSKFDGCDIRAKDQVKGTIHTVNDINVVSEHEILIDSVNGMSARIDLNKETQYIKSLGYTSNKEFINDIKYNKNKFFNDNNILIKVIDNNRVSLWEGKLAMLKNDFAEQLKNGPTSAYWGTITNINNGGYTINISGVDCFLPGSLASSGPISDFDALVGKSLYVCVVNYSNFTNNYVVSHKKYLELVLPTRVQNELFVGQAISVKVTGISMNSVFCAIADNKGEYIFPSLMHRTTMSRDAEDYFDNKMYAIGDQFKAFIHRITWDDKGSYRIVIGDKEPQQQENSEDNE